jgi:hypothetical protein
MEIVRPITAFQLKQENEIEISCEPIRAGQTNFLNTQRDNNAHTFHNERQKFIHTVYCTDIRDVSDAKRCACSG